MDNGPIIVTVTGGVAEVAENPHGRSVLIVDYDNLRELLHAQPTGDARSIMSNAEVQFLMKCDMPFWLQVEPYVIVRPLIQQSRAQ